MALLESNALPGEIIARVESHPEECREVDASRMENVLHKALRNSELDKKGSRAVVTAIIEQLNRIGCQSHFMEQNADGNPPLHEAVYRGHSVDVIKKIINSYPIKDQGTDDTEADNDDMKQIQNKWGLERKAHLRGLNTAGSNGWTALHYACGVAARSIDVVEMLFDITPAIAFACDLKGRTPFHWAVECQTEEVVSLLLSSLPNLAKCKDADGRLPLHVAVRRSDAAVLAIIAHLLGTFPSAREVMDDDGSTPHAIAVEAGAPQEILELLLVPLDSFEAPLEVPDNLASRTFLGNGGVLTTELSNAQVLLPSLSPDMRGLLKMSEVSRDGAQRAIRRNVCSPVVKFTVPPAWRSGKEDSTGSAGESARGKRTRGDAIVRLPHNGRSRNVVPWSMKDDVWSEVEKNHIMSVNDHYATLGFRPRDLPEALTAISKDGSPPINMAVIAYTDFKKKRLVLCLVENMEDELAAVKVVLKREQLVFRERSFEDLVLRKDDAVRVVVNGDDGQKVLTKKFKGKKIWFKIPLKSPRAEIRVIGGVDQDEIELDFEIIGPRRENAPQLQQQSSSCIVLYLGRSQVGAEREVRSILLSIKDKSTGGGFPPSEAFEESRWKLMNDESARDGVFTMMVRVYAAYVQVRAVNWAGASDWSDALFISPPAAPGEIVYSRSLPIFQPPQAEEAFSSSTHVEEQLRDDVARLQELCKKARLYVLCCEALSNHAHALALKFTATINIFSAAEAAKVTTTIGATISLVAKCSAPGWLKFLIKPPTPSWTQLFVEQHNAISLVGQFFSKSNYFLRNEATAKYFEDFSCDRYGLARNHFTAALREVAGDVSKLEGRTVDFAEDFGVSVEAFQVELLSVDKGDVLKIHPDVPVGSPASVVKSARVRRQSKSESQTIYISGCVHETSETMEKVKQALLKIGHEVVSSGDDFRRDGERLTDAIDHVVGTCAAFISVWSASFNNAHLSAQTHRECTVARRRIRNEVGVNCGAGGEWGLLHACAVVDFIDASRFSESMEALQTYLQSFSINPQSPKMHIQDVAPSVLFKASEGASRATKRNRFSAFLSHYKNETGTEARLVQNLLKGLVDGEVFLDSDNLQDLRLLLEQVQDSDVLILFQSKEVLTRPWVILELFTAITANVPIVTLNVQNAFPYDFEKARHFLLHFDEEIDGGASVILNENGAQPTDVAWRLYHALPNIISTAFNPNGSTNALNAAMLDLRSAMQHACSCASSALVPPVPKEEWLRNRTSSKASKFDPHARDLLEELHAWLREEGFERLAPVLLGHGIASLSSLRKCVAPESRWSDFVELVLADKSDRKQFRKKVESLVVKEKCHEAKLEEAALTFKIAGAALELGKCAPLIGGLFLVLHDVLLEFESACDLDGQLREFQRSTAMAMDLVKRLFERDLSMLRKHRMSWQHVERCVLQVTVSLEQIKQALVEIQEKKGIAASLKRTIHLKLGIKMKSTHGALKRLVSKMSSDLARLEHLITLR
jgi:hypothetical protein